MLLEASEPLTELQRAHHAHTLHSYTQQPGRKLRYPSLLWGVQSLGHQSLAGRSFNVSCYKLVNENTIKLPHCLSKSLFLKRPLKYHLLTITLGSNYIIRVLLLLQQNQLLNQNFANKQFKPNPFKIKINVNWHQRKGRWGWVRWGARKAHYSGDSHHHYWMNRQSWGDATCCFKKNQHYFQCKGSLQIISIYWCTRQHMLHHPL